MAAAHTPLEERRPPLGLRERKKLKTRTAIRRAMYRLIAEQGYEATTIEQIAAAAEVSPSTVFRYFPSKEDIVLADEYDEAIERALRTRPVDEPPLDSLRAILTAAVSRMLENEPQEMHLRTKLMAEVPALRARMTETMAETSQSLARPLADRAGRDPDDLEVRVFAASVMGALREALLYWAERDQQDDLVALVNRTLDTLKGGPGL
ncbi:TetR family transcriptional regulator [Streptomyces sp. NBC_01619]|uniref:TetR family transcriptional regulator n=2 Tax=Streptomyces pratisoli TaxID=3139917 RepID=A0ACC6QLZ3_9ACTN|nr:TetR family transcriptional regulator [Streptomyces sp. NBC_01619]MCX4512923.1 TetR family transcriptional regulator [Streptomyces sp. NBC_01619]